MGDRRTLGFELDDTRLEEGWPEEATGWLEDEDAIFALDPHWVGHPAWDYGLKGDPLV